VEGRNLDLILSIPKFQFFLSFILRNSFLYIKTRTAGPRQLGATEPHLPPSNLPAPYTSSIQDSQVSLTMTDKFQDSRTPCYKGDILRRTSIQSLIVRASSWGKVTIAPLRKHNAGAQVIDLRQPKTNEMRGEENVEISETSQVPSTG
jgi:hypothetical protein